MPGTGWRSASATGIQPTARAMRQQRNNEAIMTATILAAPANRSLAGITVPDTLLIDEAMDYARKACEPYLFNHVVRSWLFAAKIAELEAIAHDGEVLAVGTLLHDITLNHHFAGPRRFEVEGADLARSFVAERGFGERRAQLIWDSVA